MINMISNDFYADLIQELKHKKEKVAFILEHFPDSRNNDNILCSLYWKLVDKAKTVDDIMHATSPEVIRRARQKIQNDYHLYMPTDEKVLKKRRISAEIVERYIHTV
ncbi:hypothetical protein [Virgibacillus salexigens]|uniref:Uncharacterized protein n=1 Tax=Virgibacillus massiliensis TaxID=1462526 RepID=A0A024QGZ0_9BACI|nr:hypothetical protein [Virgibacillus massiliensis]CDQ41779.1 hypothetical protein BN990_04156 [Virgibacillus massiliensis]